MTDNTCPHLGFSHVNKKKKEDKKDEVSCELRAGTDKGPEVN